MTTEISQEKKLSLDQLTRELHKELAIGGLESKDVDVDKISKLMNSYSIEDNEDWKKYVFYDDNRYTRNLVDDGNSLSPGLLSDHN